MRIHRISTLPLFLSALMILTINDHYLKFAYPGFLTGKLSDFAGITAFYLFLNFLFPYKKLLNAFVTILIFAWWKSPFSEGFIHEINSMEIVNIGRTIDYSDFWALFVLPFIYFIVSDIKWNSFQFNFVRPIILVSAFFIFCATTVMHPRPLNINTQYKIDKTPDEILKIWLAQDSVRDENISCDTSNFRYNKHGQVYLIHQIYIPKEKTDTINNKLNKPLVSASITLLNDTLAISNKQTYIYFNYIYYWPYGELEKKKVYKKWFKENYIEILK